MLGPVSLKLLSRSSLKITAAEMSSALTNPTRALCKRYQYFVTQVSGPWRYRKNILLLATEHANLFEKGIVT